MAEGGFTTGPAPSAGRRGVRAHRRLRRRGRVLVRLGLRPGRDGPRRRLAAGGRGPVAPGRRAALRREPAPARRPVQHFGRTGGVGSSASRAAASRTRSCCTARPCRTTTTWTRTRRGGRPTTSPSRAWPSSSTPTRAGSRVGADLADAHAKANACDPASAFGGVIAANGPVTAELARQIADIFTEVVIAPDFDAEALGHPLRGQERPAAALCPARRRPRSNGARSAAACCSSPRTGWTSRATTRPTGSSRRGARPARSSLLIWRSRGKHAVRSNPTPSCWHRAAPRSVSAWGRSTGSTPPAWR